MPIAAKLMTSDEPPAETNGSGMPVTGISPTTTAMLMNAWMQIQAGDPRRQQRAERVGRPERRPDAQVAEGEEQHDHEPGAQQAELLADDREDEVVRRVGQEQAAGEAALAEARPDEAAEREREVALDAVEAEAGRRRSTGRARRVMRSIW